MKSKVVGEKEVKAKFGVTPQQVIDVQSLAGDSSDNIPGVPRSSACVSYRCASLHCASETENRTTDNNTVVKLKRDLWLRPRRKTHQEGVLMCRIEYASLNSACIIPQFGRVGTLLVTHFREPIHRQVSEFWYRGPGFWTGVSDAKTWMDWMEARGAKW